MKISIIIIVLLLAIVNTSAASTPVLLFSNITQGPSVGNTDPYGGGAIITIYGQNIGSIGDVIINDNTSANHIYYWGNADGNNGTHVDLYRYQNIQEVIFSLPSIQTGVIDIKIKNSKGDYSNSLKFTVTNNSIYFVDLNNGDDANTGTYTSPWKTVQHAADGNNISVGDIVYVMSGNIASDIEVGNLNIINGGDNHHTSFIVYPLSTVTMNCQNSCWHNYNSASSDIDISGFTMNTEYQAVSLFHASRIVGNNITGPTVNSGYSGWVGGGCAGEDSAYKCEGQFIAGNEVYNYGKDDGSVDTFNHLFYISNRSGYLSSGYEIAYNYLHDNPIYQGVHVYDQNPCGSWSNIKIHHNVIKNQGGNFININLNCDSDNSKIDVYNNLTVLDDDYNLTNNSAPGAAIRVETNNSTVVNLYNNTFYKWAEVNQLKNGIITVDNCVFYNTRPVDFTSDVPINHHSNSFYNSQQSTYPIWADYTSDPQIDTIGKPNLNSILIDNGIVTNTSIDLIGQSIPVGNYDIGVYEIMPVTIISIGTSPMIH